MAAWLKSDSFTSFDIEVISTTNFIESKLITKNWVNKKGSGQMSAWLKSDSGKNIF